MHPIFHHIHKHVCRAHHRFKLRRKKKSFFNTLLIAAAVILVWRSLWGLADEYLFPHSPIWSRISGLFIGLVILYLDDNNIEELQ